MPWKLFSSLATLLTCGSLAAACGSSSSPSTTDDRDGGAVPNAQLDGGDGEDATARCELVVPDAYESPEFDTHASVELAARAKHGEVGSLMRSAELDITVVPTAAELGASFGSGSPSLRSMTTSYYADRIDAYAGAFAAAAGNTWTPPTAPGGLFGNYIFSTNGVALRPAVVDGMLAATFYHHAYVLMTGEITDATLDRLLATYGSSPSFPAGEPDTLAALFAKRRDPGGEAPGPYRTLKTAFLTAKAAVAGGASCTSERDAALATIRSEWERTLFATAIFYLNDAIQRIDSGASIASLSGGLYAYGRAVALIHGYRELPAAARTITDAQIDGLLSELRAASLEGALSYELVTSPDDEPTHLASAIDTIAGIYGFSPQQVETFKINY